jgi:hypothetical protein
MLIGIWCQAVIRLPDVPRGDSLCNRQSITWPSGFRGYQYLDLTTYVHGRTEPGRVGFYQNAWYSYIWKDPKGSSEITEGVREQEDQFSWDGDEHLPVGRRYGGRLSASYLDL